MENAKNSYESLFIVEVANAEATTKETVEKFTNIIAQNAEIVEIETMGKRRLAYPINDMNEGFYTIVTFKSDANFPAELERLYSIDEHIMRSMTLRLGYDAVPSVKAEAAVPADTNAAATVESVPAAAESLAGVSVDMVEEKITSEVNSEANTKEITAELDPDNTIVPEKLYSDSDTE